MGFQIQKVRSTVRYRKTQYSAQGGNRHVPEFFTFYWVFPLFFRISFASLISENNNTLFSGLNAEILAYQSLREN